MPPAMVRPPIPLPRTARPGGYPAAPGSFDMWGGIRSGLGNNSNALIQLGSGLLSQNTFAKGVAAAGQGWAAGNQQDQQQAAIEEAKGRKNATLDYLKSKRPDIYAQYQAGLPIEEAAKLAFTPIKLGQGDVLIDPTTMQPMASAPGAGGGGTYGGTSMDAQNWNILLKAANDPAQRATPEYAAAYAQLTEPKITYQMTPDGLMPVMQQPNIPQWVQPPPGMAAPASQPAAGGVPATPGSVTPAGAPTPSVGAGNVSAGGVIPGTMPKPMEGQIRIGMLSKTLSDNVPVVHAGFAALADPTQQLLGLGGNLTNPWQSDEYQRAARAVGQSAGMILYALSGAAASSQETAKRIDDVTPKFGDKPGVIADRLRAFDTYVRSLAEASGDPQVKALAEQVLKRANAGPAGPPIPAGLPSAAVQQPGGGNTTSTGVTWSF